MSEKVYLAINGDHIYHSTNKSINVDFLKLKDLLVGEDKLWKAMFYVGMHKVILPLDDEERLEFNALEGRFGAIENYEEELEYIKSVEESDEEELDDDYLKYMELFKKDQDYFYYKQKNDGRYRFLDKMRYNGYKIVEKPYTYNEEGMMILDVDLEMSVDMAMNHTNVDRFIIISDSVGMGHAVQKMSDSGKHVTVASYGSDRVSYKLRETCDRFVDLSEFSDDIAISKNGKKNSGRYQQQ